MDALLDVETLELIYEAALEPASWEQAIIRIANACQSHGGQILLWDSDSAGAAFSRSVSHAADPALAERLFTEHYCAIDPRRQYAMSLPVGEWMACHHICDDQFVASNEFYQDFFIPIYGGRYISGARLADQNGLHAMFAVARSVASSSKPFDEASLRYLRSLSPHLARAARLHLQITRLRGELDQRNAALERLSLPILIVERDATIRFSNAAAEASLKRAEAQLGLHQGRLIARSAADVAALLAAIDGAVTKRLGMTLGIGVAGTARLVCTVVPLSPRTQLEGSRQRPMALIVLNDPHSPSDLQPEALSALFGLTPAEARLALAIAAGQSVAACATRFGVSPLTARAQLRAIFDKVGVHRQAELVSMLQRISPGIRTSRPHTI